MKQKQKSVSGAVSRYVPLWVIPVLIVFAVGTVWLRLYLVRTTYQINETGRAIQGLRLEQEKTELKLAGLRSPKRLEALAKGKYGLTRPRLDQVVHLSRGQASPGNAEP